MANSGERKLVEMIGLTATKCHSDEENIWFEFSDGSSAVFNHHQDCCEQVCIEDINGDLSDLVGVPILVAEERYEYSEDSYGDTTWTFYTFRTIKGSVDVRWLGTSNGYYATGVSFNFTKGGDGK